MTLRGVDREGAGWGECKGRGAGCGGADAGRDGGGTAGGGQGVRRAAWDYDDRFKPSQSLGPSRALFYI